MPEPEAERSGQGAVNQAAPGSRWRNTLMTIGFFGMLAALAIGASMKEASGQLPKYLALGSIALIVITGIWALIERLLHKGGR